MNNITNVSDITYQDVAEYCRIDELSQDDINTLNNLIDVAKSFIRSYTGQDDLDAYNDFVIVVFILVQDMWDNRTMYVDKSNLNKVVDTILGMHAVNLL
ncbi:head-tail connector protein [Sharpea azabuensis]|uniref:head-tail connector protein n=1 Tax=Sharpea azabuensis TaxID=322505 RepID=UPI002E814769|nr:head-tail connector protein [Sharpea azabuensis]MEE3307841.1 head-tail connector protein [Sharpea azabuensis]